MSPGCGSDPGHDRRTRRRRFNVEYVEYQVPSPDDGTVLPPPSDSCGVWWCLPRKRITRLLRERIYYHLCIRPSPRPFPPLPIDFGGSRSSSCKCRGIGPRASGPRVVSHAIEAGISVSVGTGLYAISAVRLRSFVRPVPSFWRRTLPFFRPHIPCLLQQSIEQPGQLAGGGGARARAVDGAIERPNGVRGASRWERRARWLR